MVNVLQMLFEILSSVLPIACPYCAVGSGEMKDVSDVVKNLLTVSGVLLSFVGIGAGVLLWIFDIVRKEQEK